jgi:transposase
LPLFSELGRDMDKWPTVAHFASWLALCPDNDISGGRVLWRGIRKVKNRRGVYTKFLTPPAGQMFRLAAHSLHRSATPLGDFLRRLKAKLGPAAAITATAHKIAVIFYTMLKRQVEYDATLWAASDLKRQHRAAARLQRQARRLGYQLVPVPPLPA